MENKEKSPHEEEADRLIEWYEDQEWTGGYCTESGEEDFLNFMNKEQSTKCALNDVENTIKVLEEITDDKSSWEGYKEKVLEKLNFQTKVRDILKNKLK